MEKKQRAGITTGQGDIGVSLGVPIAVATLVTLLNTTTGITALFFISIGAITTAVVAAGLSQLLSGASFTIFGTGFTLPQMTGWFLRFEFASIFLILYYTANIFTALNLLLSVPLYIGVILVGVLTSIFVFGLFSLATGQMGES